MIYSSIVHPTNLGAAQNNDHLDWESFINSTWQTMNSQPEDIPKEKLQAITTGTFSNDKRNLNNFQKLNVLAIDIDHKMTKETFSKWIEYLGDQNLAYMAFESPSSGLPEKGFRARLYLKLDREYTDSDEYKASYGPTIEKLLPSLPYDSACKDATRLMYIPNISKAHSFKWADGDSVKMSDPKPLQSNELQLGTKSSGLGDLVANAQGDKIRFNKQQIDQTKWAEEVFGLVEGGKAPHSPFRLDSDSGNFAVHHYGIYDFITETIIKWEELLEAFSHTPDPAKVHAWYIDKWEAAGKPQPPLNLLKGRDAKSSSMKLRAPAFVEVMQNKGRYFLTLERTEGTPEHLVPLDRTSNEFEVCLQIIEHGILPSYWPRESLGKTFTDGTEQKFKFDTKDLLKAKYRDNTRDKYILLGSENKGNYYDVRELKLVESLHGTKKVKGKFHKQIDDFIKQINISTEWLYEYLYYLPDCTKRLPWIHCYSKASGTGKTFIAHLFASVWTTSPVLDPLEDPKFHEGWGNSPVMLLDEQIPYGEKGSKNSINRLKGLVTEMKHNVNLKFAALTSIIGAHRVVSTQNADEPSLPLEGQDDLTALQERLQMIRFTPENRVFIEGITRIVTDEWVRIEFAEYVQWIRDTKEFPERTGRLAVHTLPDEFFQRGVATISEVNTKVLEGICNIIDTKQISAGFLKTEKTFHYLRISGSDFQKHLKDAGYMKNRWSYKKIFNLIKEACPSTLEKRVTVIGGERVRGIEIQNSEIESLEKILGM